MIRSMVQRARELLLFLSLALFTKLAGAGADKAGFFWPPDDVSHCLSWRTAVESGNARAWRTVPVRCLRCVEAYMLAGQYDRDVRLVVDLILDFAAGISVSADGLDAWVLDVDDTCLSNVFYYSQKRYGCDPYDPSAFKAWAMRGSCRAIPGVLVLFNKLIKMGFKVFLITGRDEETLGQSTIHNLHNEGFCGYKRLILRTEAHKGQSAVQYKSEVRKQIIGQGYRIWGNVGDQWSDLQGDCLGNRTFKIPNPMYFIP